MPIELLAGVGHSEPPRRAIEQANAELGLELLDPVAQRRLRDAQRASRRREAAAVHHLDEVMEVVEIEHAPSIVQHVGR